jgi:hypothetical protein
MARSISGEKNKVSNALNNGGRTFMKPIGRPNPEKKTLEGSYVSARKSVTCDRNSTVRAETGTDKDN